jgi:glycosyltransferase involved in cell wall biosynthesis
MRQMNFLFLTTFYPPYSFGGDGMYVHRLAHALGDAGHHVDVAHCLDSYNLLHPKPPEIAFAEHPNVTRHELRSGWGPVSPLATQQTGRPVLKRGAIKKLLAGRRYDVIHYHNMSLIGAGALEMESPYGRTVKVYTAHEHWLICPMHVLWKFNERPCEKPECLRCTLHGRRPPQWWRYTGLLKRAARRVDQFISPSRFTARMHAERGFPQTVTPVPYFVDRTDGDWREPGPRPQERPYFVFVGRLEYIKGLQTLIETWRGITDWDLLVAGTGTYEQQLRAAAAPNPRIRFLGPRSQRELGALYHHALACLVPSITYETFGVISVEAFARKTPVIVRDLGALPEVVEDSGGGFTYRTEAELLEALRSLAASPERRAEMGERGYRAFLRMWTPEAHLALYYELLGDCARRKYGRVPWEQDRLRVSVA